MTERLERQFSPPDIEVLDKSEKYHILVLGGGFGHDDSLPPTSLLSPFTLGRLVEGIRIINQLPQSILITSGGSNDNQTPQAEIIRDAAIYLGASGERIQTQSTPWNTQHEAIAYTTIHGTDTPLILVTCATHMPRAIKWFRKYGVRHIIPAPVNHVVKKDSKFRLISLLPHPENLLLFQKALKEYVGILLVD